MLSSQDLDGNNDEDDSDVDISTRFSFDIPEVRYTPPGQERVLRYGEHFLAHCFPLNDGLLNQKLSEHCHPFFFSAIFCFFTSIGHESFHWGVARPICFKINFRVFSVR